MVDENVVCYGMISRVLAPKHNYVGVIQSFFDSTYITIMKTNSFSVPHYQFAECVVLVPTGITKKLKLCNKF